MKLERIFSQRKKHWNSLKQIRNGEERTGCECKSCKTVESVEKWKKNRWICAKCSYYMPMAVMDRIELIADEKSFKELFAGVSGKNPLNFPGYEKKLEVNREKTGSKEAFVAGVCKIDGIPAAIGVLDGNFLMGSMGTVVGEKIVRLSEYAKKKKLPLIIFSASGGARMQEGLFSLMQMAKTSAAVERFKQAGGLFISCLTNPTTGGVSASYASLGDIMIAEPDALIGFAGPRVIEQTIGQKLPEGFQRSSFLLEHGMIDMIVERKRLKSTLSRLLKLHAR